MCPKARSERIIRPRCSAFKELAGREPIVVVSPKVGRPTLSRDARMHGWVQGCQPGWLPGGLVVRLREW